MTTLTIHADDDLAAAVRTAAEQAGRSINVFLTEVIASSLGVSGKRPPPAFMKVSHRVSAAGARELLSVQASSAPDFSIRRRAAKTAKPSTPSCGIPPCGFVR